MQGGEVKQKENAARALDAYSSVTPGLTRDSFPVAWTVASVYCGFSTRSRSLLRFSFQRSSRAHLRVPLVYFNTPPREEIDGTRYELAAP